MVTLGGVFAPLFNPGVQLEQGIATMLTPFFAPFNVPAPPGPMTVASDLFSGRTPQLFPAGFTLPTGLPLLPGLSTASVTTAAQDEGTARRVRGVVGGSTRRGIP